MPVERRRRHVGLLCAVRPQARHAGRLASRAVRDVEVVAAALVVLALVGWIDLRPDQAHAAVRWLAARLADLAGGLPWP